MTASGVAPTESPERLAQEIMLELAAYYDAPEDEYLWPWENARWRELCFSILAATVDPRLRPETVREAVRTLTECRLLEIELLADLPCSGNGQAQGDVVVTLRTILHRYGFDAQEANAATQTICSLAASLVRSYQGQVQRLLRHHAEQMLQELQAMLPAKGIDRETGRRALALWLQNALNLPIPCQTLAAQATCTRLGTSYTALVQAADELGFNVALIDEALLAIEEDRPDEIALEASA